MRPSSLVGGVLAAVLAIGVTVTATDHPDSAGDNASAAGLNPPSSNPRLVDGQHVTDALAELDRLSVRPADTGAHYDRDDWLDDWPSTGHGCDLRDAILNRDALASRKGQPMPVRECRKTNAYWVSSYDNTKVQDAADLDIDHIVPLGEAAVSDTRGWTEQQRHRYATDPTVLLAVSTSSNRAKSDQDPAHWLPSNTAERCDYATRWVRTKTRYRMSADTAEVGALRSVLTHCGGGAH